MAKGEVLIRAEGVGKKFCSDLKKSLWYGVKDVVHEVLPLGGGKNSASRLRPKEFWAVQDVSFELRRGECMALIGRNGAGKTTLLKTLNGLIKPDTGRIEMKGQVAAMIALGAGFNPLLTGRENIYISGSLRGMSKREVDSKIDSIIEFAEIQKFIDMPVQGYSSGMQVRLGFSVASSLNPDIMLIDEVLAVGDAAFRFKCLRRIAELRQNTAMVLVSHSMQQIGLACDRGIVMSKGCKVADGTAQEAIEVYESLNEGPKNAAGSRHVAPPFVQAQLHIPNVLSYGDSFRAAFSVESAEPVPQLYALFKIIDSDEQVAAEINSQSLLIDLPAGQSEIEITAEKLFLKPGNYQLNTTFYQAASMARLAWFSRTHSLKIEGSPIHRQSNYQMVGRLAVKSAAL